MRKTIILCLIVLMSVSVSISARPNFNPSAAGGGQTPTVPPPNFAQQPPIIFHKLTAEVVLNTLIKEGLAVDPIWPKKTKRATFKFDRQIQFKYKGYKGYICEFNSEKYLDKAQEETLKLNSKREEYTWSLTQDNIILVLDGKLPEEEFLKFQNAVRNIN